jgi:hypothetical protein
VLPARNAVNAGIAENAVNVLQRSWQDSRKSHPPFADVTPWADEVGVDFNIQSVHKMERFWLRKL